MHLRIWFSYHFSLTWYIWETYLYLQFPSNIGEGCCFEREEERIEFHFSVTLVAAVKRICNMSVRNLHKFTLLAARTKLRRIDSKYFWMDLRPKYPINTFIFMIPDLFWEKCQKFCARQISIKLSDRSPFKIDRPCHSRYNIQISHKCHISKI